MIKLADEVLGKARQKQLGSRVDGFMKKARPTQSRIGLPLPIYIVLVVVAKYVYIQSNRLYSALLTTLLGNSNHPASKWNTNFTIYTHIIGLLPVDVVRL